MYNLQKISDYSTCPQIQALYSDLPKKPYCTNAKGMCRIRTKRHAITHAYIQPNTPFKVKWLVFDVDDPNALFAFHDNNTPRPQLIIKNPTNGHAHYCYKLAFPVALMGETNQKAIKYLDSVYNALKRKLGADMGYSGNLIKNPTHSDWQTYTTGANAQGYTLDELAEYLDLDKPTTAPKVANDDYFGRNCSVFHATRHQAYKIADKHDYNTLLREVLAIATAENAKFDSPMYPNEVRHIAKSITNYCKSPKFGKNSQVYFEKRSNGGKKGSQVANAKGANSKGGKARSESYNAQREQAKQLRGQGLSVRKIADQLQISKTSVQKWIKSD